MGKAYALAVSLYIVSALLCLQGSAKGFEGSQANLVKGSDEIFYEAGSYVRKYFFFKLYRVALFTLSPDIIARMYLKQEKGRATKEPSIDSLADFLLDPANGVPLRLTVELLRDKVKYSLQKEAVRSMLGRAEFPVDENWKLMKSEGRQEDVTLYVKTMIGMNERDFEALRKRREKGDRYTLAIDANNQAWVKYTPSRNNTGASSQKVYFSSSELLRGIFSTYISRRACSPDLEDELPDALLEKIVSAYSDQYAEIPNQDAH